MALNFYNANRWVKCPSSAGEPAGPMPEPSTPQLEGRAAAGLADAVFRRQVSECAELIDRTVSGYIVDGEMADYVQGYVDFVQSRGNVLSEISAEWYGIKGRPDSVIVDSGQVVEAFELKYGWKIVEPDESYQLALAVLSMIRKHHTHARLWVYQPRPAHPDGVARYVTWSREHLESVAQEIMRAADEARMPNPPARPGAEQCEHCPRRLSCVALLQTDLSIFETIQSTRHQGKTSGAQLGKEYAFLEQAAKLIEARLTAIRAEANERAKNGEFIPGYGLDPKFTQRQFDVDPETIRFLTGLNPYKQVLKTPAELEKEGAPEEIINVLNSSKYIGHELKRWNTKKIERLFR